MLQFHEKTIPIQFTEDAHGNPPCRTATFSKKIMSVVKVIEILAESNVSWEEATRQALAKVTRTVHQVKSIHIKEMSAKVENGVITSFRINAKVSFRLDG